LISGISDFVVQKEHFNCALRSHPSVWKPTGLTVLEAISIMKDANRWHRKIRPAGRVAMVNVYLIE
jgi:hypothetical protein